MFLLAVAAVTRLFPHPMNFAPIGAMALASGAYLGRNVWGFLAPLGIYWISDLLVNNILYAEFYNSFILFTPGFGWLYLSFAMIIVLGSIVLKKVSIPRVLGGAFGVWLSDPDYPLTWGGFLLCYEMAIPFFRSTLASDLLYSAAFFGIVEWVRHSSSTLSWDEKLVE